MNIKISIVSSLEKAAQRLTGALLVARRWLTKRYYGLPRRAGVLLGIIGIAVFTEVAFSVSPKAATEVIYGGPAVQASAATEDAFAISATEALPGIFDEGIDDFPATVKSEANNSDGNAIAGSIFAASQVKGSGEHYTVLPGDTLYSVAHLNSVDMKELVALNRGVAEPLIVGDQLALPARKEPITVAAGVNWNGDLPPGFMYPADGPLSTKHGRFQARDIPNKLGTPIRAASDGTVIEASFGYSGGYGNHILVEHDAAGVITMYAHLMDGGILVVPGQKVKKGEVMGYMGSTGHSTGPHVHFEVRPRN